MLKTLLLDQRDEQALYREMVALAKAYIPQWTVEDNGDPGSVLLGMYAAMMADTVSRYNKMLTKHVLFFLNLLGAERLNGQCAKGYATVKLAPGDYDGVFIEKGTRLYRQDQQGERVIYETTAAMQAVASSIDALFCCNSDGSCMVQLDMPQAQQEKDCRLFDFAAGENLQKIGLYISEANMLLVGTGGEISITFCHEEKAHMEKKLAEFLSVLENASWGVLSATGFECIDVIGCVDNKISFKVNKPVEETAFAGHASRWLACRIHNIKEAQNLSFTHLEVTASETGLQPVLYANDVQLGTGQILPFSHAFSIYDSLFINCESAFCKAGAIIDLTFDLHFENCEKETVQEEKRVMAWKPIMRKSALEEPPVASIAIAEVMWEYWNGNGWARLFNDHRYQTIFDYGDKKSITITFHCPPDMQTLIVGAHQGRWVRASIRRIRNAFKPTGRYCVPVLENVSMHYAYRQPMPVLEKVIAEKDVALYGVDVYAKEETVLAGKPLSEYPAIYFALDKPFQGGPMKLFFQMGGKTDAPSPVLRWEYFGGKSGPGQWIDLKEADETASLSQSGIVTFIIHTPFKKQVLFGKESYWLRAVNTDAGYEKTDVPRPVLKGIHMNTVPIVQQESLEAEYFFIQDGEKNKVCKLANPNVVSHKVWVNEAPAMPADVLAQDDASFLPGTKLERDAQGMVVKAWVPWQRVERFLNWDGQARVYMLEEQSGTLYFGDGKNGKIPCSGDTGTICVAYKVGAYERGNCVHHGIAGFADSVPFVEAVFNPEPVIGGSAMESLEDAVARSTQMVKVQNRAVSLEDYQVIVKQADRNIEKVKIFAHHHREGSKPGELHIVVLPRFANQTEQYFSGIAGNIHRTLAERAPATLVRGDKIKVIEASYIEFSLVIEGRIACFEDYAEVYRGIEQKLERYFNPVSGNSNGKGFEIGEMPSKMQLYHELKTVNKLEMIDNLYISCFEIIQSQRRELDFTAIGAQVFGVPVNGHHEINLHVIG